MPNEKDQVQPRFDRELATARELEFEFQSTAAGTFLVFRQAFGTPEEFRRIASSAGDANEQNVDRLARGA